MIIVWTTGAIQPPYTGECGNDVWNWIGAPVAFNATQIAKRGWEESLGPSPVKQAAIGPGPAVEQSIGPGPARSKTLD